MKLQSSTKGIKMGNKGMSKELEKVCEESFKRNRRYNPIKMVYVIQQQAYEEGFRAAIEYKRAKGGSWEDLWKKLLENEDGSINKAQLKLELQDFSDLIARHSKVVCSLTNGRMSYVTYSPDAIISLVEEIHQEEIDKIYEQVQGLIEGLESMIKHCETCDDSGYVTLINTDLDIDCPDCLGKSILALEKFRGGAE